MEKRTCGKNMEDDQIISTYLVFQAAECFTIIYDRYVSKVYAKCIALLKDETLAHDATQEIFIKVFMNLSKFGGKSKFSTWLYSITYNFCIDYIRKRKKQGRIFSDEMEKTPEPVEEEVSDKEILEIELERLKRVLEQLPVGDKAVLLMKYLDGMQIKEIAEALNKTESAIKMKIKRAKAKALEIKAKLEPEYV